MTKAVHPAREFVIADAAPAEVSLTPDATLIKPGPPVSSG
jgi:hypothetical protein